MLQPGARRSDFRLYHPWARRFTIHRSDCNKLLQSLRNEPQRLIEVDWGGSANSTYPATIRIEAFDRPGLLRDISALLASEHINVVATSTNTNKQDNMATMVITMEVEGLDALARLLGRISQLPNIVDVARLKEN